MWAGGENVFALVLGFGRNTVSDKNVVKEARSPETRKMDPSMANVQ